MKKLLATLKVYEDPEFDNNALDYDDGNEYTLRLGGKSDGDRKTVMAHELGHFIARVTQDPTHNPFYAIYANLANDPRKLIPGEELAWKLAREMVPANEFDERAEREALQSYHDGVKRYLAREAEEKEWQDSLSRREPEWAGWV